MKRDSGQRNINGPGGCSLDRPTPADRACQMPRKIRSIRIEGNIAFVPLTRGYEAKVDIADLPLVAGFMWAAMVTRRPDGGIKKIYATRNMPRSARPRGRVFMHRAIIGAPPEKEVDHADGDGLNNCRDNLRLATASQNAQNRKTPSNNTSGHKGVQWNRKIEKWVVRIKKDGRMKEIGAYLDKEEAAASYADVSRVLFGDFARRA